MLEEGTRILHPDSQLVMKVSPFEPGSFIMDIAMHMQQHPEHGGIFAMLASQAEHIQRAKEVLECIGLVKKAGEYGASLLELLRRLKNGKPNKVEKKGDAFESETYNKLILDLPKTRWYAIGVVSSSPARRR